MSNLTLDGKGANAATDKILKDTENEIKKIYQQAEAEVEQKLKNHLEKFEKSQKKMADKLDQALENYKKGKISFKEYTQAKKDYERWYINQTMTGKRWEALKQTLAEDLTNASLIAESVINGHMADAYALNYNYMIYEMETGTFVDSFIPIYDKNAMEYILREHPDLLPQYNINIPKAMRWNKQKINSAVMQGILQGDSINNLAKRLRSVTTMDYNASIRNARTASGAATNKGKEDSFKRIKDMGFDIKKQWISTLDSRTRHEHRLLMGQTVDLGQPFTVNGYELEYPCDPNASFRDMLGSDMAVSVIEAAPEMIYNCRCVIVGILAGYEKTIEDFDYQTNPKLGGMTLDEWKEAKPVYGKR